MPMQQMLQDIISHETNEESFIVDDAYKAEWAVKKIEQEKNKLEQFESVCDSMILSYNEKKNAARQKYENSISYLKGQLRNFFETVERKVTKTQESYALPSGKLVLKYEKPKFEINKDGLVEWLKDNKRTDLIKTKEEPMWAELKKEVEVHGSTVTTPDGEIIEGVIVEVTEPEFEIKF